MIPPKTGERTSSTDGLLVEAHWIAGSGRPTKRALSTPFTAGRKRLHRILDDLFRNAQDHGDGDAVVHVGELLNGFFVEDDGSGIPVISRETAFEVGYTTRAEGPGFGLALIRDIVEAHGWSISVTEGDAGGARFEIIDVDISPTG